MKGEIEVRSKIGEEVRFPQTARSCLQKRGWQGKGDGKERHGQENLNGSKK